MRSSSRPMVTQPGRRSRGRHALAWVWILGSCLAVLVATYMMFVEPPPPRSIVIASGGRNGAYYRFARRYAEELQKEGLSVEVRETAGSVENLRLLGEDGSGVTVAIVQGGLAGPEEARHIQALGSLYREPLWVFYRGQERLERLSQLAGRRIGVGPEGSGTHAIAMQLLAANGLIDSGSSGEKSRAVLVEGDVAAAAAALAKGELDAAFFVAAFEADYIRGLLGDGRVSLLGFGQHEAYHRRFRFLAPVTMPAGLLDLGRNIPDRDVALLAPTAMLVVRHDLHPALASLLLTTATRIHGEGDELSNPGEFPSESYCDFPLSEGARRFYKFGPPVLQRLLPFWLASLVDRAKVMLIPIVMLMMPLLRAAPPLMRWRTRRKIYLWYSDLRDIDQSLIARPPGSGLDAELARLEGIEHQVARVDVPLSYMKEFYHLRLHLDLLRQRLVELRAGVEPSVGARGPLRVFEGDRDAGDPEPIRYEPSVEVEQTDEAELIDKIVASMGRVNRKVFEKHRHATRDAHAKSHGVLKGTLTVRDGLPDELRQGLLATPRAYPIIVRFSSAPGDIQDDRIASLRGMAIKVIGVEGPRLLPGDEVTQDFLLVNDPVLPFGTVAAYWEVQQSIEKHADDPDFVKRLTVALAGGARKALKLIGKESETLDAVAPPNHHLLGETFHSMAALRFGDFLAKLSAAPLSDSVRQLTGRPIDAAGNPSILRDLVVDFFRTNEAEYELRAQLCVELGRMPVEDASVHWPEDLSAASARRDDPPAGPGGV